MTMPKKRTVRKPAQTLIVLDFDGFLIDSYRMLKMTFDDLGLDLGDVDRFRHRRKFLKYIGGGKEFLGNLISYALPKQKKIRAKLTDTYMEQGEIYTQFTPLLNQLIESPVYHIGVISRNFTHNPGRTIRQVFRNSGVNEQDLDFVIPVPIGAKKHDVLEGMKSDRFVSTLFGADEISDYRAASETGYESIIMGSYGFDNRERLINHGDVPEHMIGDSVHDTTEMICQTLGTDKPARNRADRFR